jgi:hypothetical protein
MPIFLRPRLTHAPWAGFTKHDCPRKAPMPICPSPKCRRVKHCVAAHDGLYCQRTHFSPREQKKWRRHNPYESAVAELLAMPEAPTLAGRLQQLMHVQIVRLEQAIAMTDRWKEGEFDHLYGPYRKKGVVVGPPPLRYVEETLPRPTHTRVRALG